MKGAAARGSVQLGVEGAFMAASGYVGLLILARSLGPTEFGLYSVIISFIVWIERTTMLGIPSAVTKLIAEGRRSVNSTAVVISVVLIGFVTVTLIALAPALAKLFQAPGQETLFRIAALDIPFYGMFLLYRGVAMGQHKFGIVMGSGLILGSTKVIAVAWIVISGYGLLGAMIAYIIGSLAGLLLLAIYFPMWPTPPDREIGKTIISIAIPFALASLGLSIIHSLDLWLLKALTPPELGRDVGVYAATRVLARVPELIMLPVGTVLFPLVSRSLARNESGLVADYVKGGMRALWLILLPVVAFVTIDAEPILRLFFPSSYHGGGAFLSLQILAFCELTALGILLALLKARGDFYTAVIIGLAMPLAVLALALILIPQYATMGAAFAFVAAVTIGLLVSAVLVYQRFGTLISGSALIKGMIATGILLPVSVMISANNIWLIPKYLVIAFLYIGLLWLMKELRKEDLEPLFSWR